MRIIFFILLCGLFQQASGQEIGLGTWRTHACYQEAKQVAVGEEGAFCATVNGLFLFSRQDQSLQILTKQQGLSNASPTQIGYDTPRKTLLIAYPDRTIDLLKDNTITEISLLRQASFSNSPQINQIVPTASFAYLATDFGVVLLDVGKQEVRETYRNLGVNGAELAVLGLAFSQDSLVLATAQGVMIGAVSSNLADFQQWKRFGATNNLPTQAYKKIVTRQNNVYALSTNNQLFKYTHLNTWALVNLPTETYTDLALVGNDLVLTSAGKLTRLDNNDQRTTQTNALLAQPQSARMDSQGTLWVADAVNGLLAYAQNEWKSYVPNSPASANTWQARFAQDKIVVTSGGFDNTLQPLQRKNGYYSFANGAWSSFVPPALLRDLTSYASTQNIEYLGSYGAGLWARKPDGSFEQFTNSNAPLETSGVGDVRITDLVTDAEGTLWVANHAVDNGENALHARKTNGTWQSFLPPSPAGRYPLEILVAQNGWKWIRLGNELGGGIWVLDEKNNRSRWLNATPNQGNLPSSAVGAIVEDKDGLIWVGTGKGIAVFYTPQDAFSTINALLPIYGGRPLLRDEVVNTMVVDGGNRKWVGTTTGLWLFDAEGTKLLQYFTTQNSPLPSNNVQNMALHPQTGELFVLTDAGMVSYRGTATEAQDEYSNAQVFPNPVYPDFDGLVGVSGLPTGAKVKITDISGRLFYETVAEGGTASWNLTDYQGTRAKAGIYLIYTFKPDGTEAKVLKVAVLE
ncbi:MAG: hypothetical protein EAZ95_10840 [Bacteroidetes bacterium]|nr:MAG: hypothetical protein EAZ95_10840 [Bacteroidota bacterium]